MATSSLPLLLPSGTIPKTTSGWQPSQYLQMPKPPVVENTQAENELAIQRQLMDGKALKKTRPRRTVDYTGGIGKWALLRKTRPNPTYVPYMRPSPPYIIDLLPPKAYPNNPSTSLCTKFIHTSTNKIRCPVNVVTWTPEGRRVLTGSTSGEFTLWNGLTFNFETILQAHDSAIRAMRFTHSGAYIASADQSGVIKYYQPNMNNLNAWPGHREAIRGLSFSPDDSRFATASDDSTVKLWSFEESREERALTGHGWDVKCVEWHPTKGLLVTGSKDNLVKFWDPRTGTCLSTLHQHKNTVQAVAWSPNGDYMASASRDQTVRVFDIRAMKEFRVFKGHKKEVCSVTWHPVHPILVTGGSEGAIIHWDLNSPSPSPSIPPAPRATLSQAHDSNVWSLAFHPLGHLLCSGSNDHTTRFWSRERPGDVSSVFAGGGEKPPEADANGMDDEEEEIVPGLGGGGGEWWGREENGPDSVPGFGGPGPSRNEDAFIPGFGRSNEPERDRSAPGRTNGPLPPQQDMYGHGERPGGREEDWARGGPGYGGRGNGGSAGGGGGRWGRDRDRDRDRRRWD